MSKEPEITEKLIKEHGLKEDEYERILSILGRKPTFTELGIFSVMWSEHCSYKSSRLHLRKFPNSAEWVVVKPGENAGAIDIGNGIAAIFKIESHNHPSYIEPYQGAATGVGGILRDIFTMGARPMASLNSLRFGPLTDPYHRHLFHGVVGGIAGYGNCIGVPTVGGEIYSHPCYAGNILVNVFNLGIAKIDGIFYGSAGGIGNHVIYVGSKTGRDGIHGVTMASEEFTDDADQKRPNVQVGDPFTEKLLVEACLEAMKKGLIVGIQDMGGAGLTSSSSEMAGRAGTGIEMELSNVPLREAGMIPYEIMLSESQERMLIVCEEGHKDELIGIFKKWDLEAAIVGKVTGDGKLRIKWHGEVVADIDALKISTNAPLYDRPSKRPDYQIGLNSLDIKSIIEPSDNNAVLKKLLSSVCITSKNLVWEQYDHMVRTNTVQLPGSSAAVIRVKEAGNGLAMSADCNSRYCYLDPYLGGVHAVCEAARNVACTGAISRGATNCLNFGNPEKPEVMWQLINAIQGAADACAILETPVVSGNVSLYNETRGAAIYPTPVFVVVGVLDDPAKALSHDFKEAGDIVMLIGDTYNDLGGSEYLYIEHGLELGLPPHIDCKKEKVLHRLLVDLNNEGLLKSAIDCSDGGLAVALAEAAIAGGIGAEIEIEPILQKDSQLRVDSVLFGESATRVVVSVNPINVDKVTIAVNGAGLSICQIGKVGGEYLRIDSYIDQPINDIKYIYENSLKEILTR